MEQKEGREYTMEQKEGQQHIGDGKKDKSTLGDGKKGGVGSYLCVRMCVKCAHVLLHLALVNWVLVGPSTITGLD